jgi:hypothetical protein
MSRAAMSRGGVKTEKLQAMPPRVPPPAAAAAARPPWWAHAALPALLPAALFACTLSFGYTFDDRAAVRDQPDVSNPASPYWALWTHDFWGAPVASALSNKSWRPLTTSAFRFVRVLAAPPPGAPLPARPFHALNVALHAAVTWQVHALAGALAAWEAHPRPRACAAAAALLFAAHPVHVEAVAGLVGAAELLCALAALAGLRCYMRAAAPGTPHTGRALAAALLLALVAALSKETGLTALGTFLGYEWLIWGAGDGKATSRGRRIAGVLAAGALYGAARRAVLGPQTLVTAWRVADNHLPFLPTARATVLTVAHTHWRYAYLLLWPAQLCADWNYACIPPVTRLSDARNAGAAALYAAAAACVLMGAASRHRPARLRLFHAAGLLGAPLLPAANVLTWVGAYLAERLLYLPSVGFCLLLAGALTRLRVRPGGACVATLALLYAARTAARLPAWRSDATLFAAGAVTCPDGARARFNAGVQLRMAGDCAAAEPHFRAALRILPEDNCGVRMRMLCLLSRASHPRCALPQPLYELGQCAFNAGRLGEAAGYFETSLDCIDTVANAREAVRKVLALLHNAHPREAAVLLAYARVIARVDGVAGEEDACAALGAAALLLEEKGHAEGAASARALCAAGPEAAAAAAAVPHGLLGAGRCDAEAPAALAAFAAARDVAGRDAVGTGFVQQWGTACRGNAAYFKAVHALQVSLPYNPHLHVEWARLLREQLTQDAPAAMHMEFALNTFEAAAREARARGLATERREAVRAAARVRAERTAWGGKPAGPRSVKKLIDTPLKLEL